MVISKVMGWLLIWGPRPRSSTRPVFRPGSRKGSPSPLQLGGANPARRPRATSSHCDVCVFQPPPGPGQDPKEPSPKARRPQAAPPFSNPENHLPLSAAGPGTPPQPEGKQRHQRAKRKERPPSASGRSGSSSGNGEVAQRRRGLLNSWQHLYAPQWWGRSVASSGVCSLAAMGSGMWRRGRDRRKRAPACGAEPSALGRHRRGPVRSPRAVKPGLTARSLGWVSAWSLLGSALSAAFHLCTLQGHISGTSWRERAMESLPCFLVSDSSNFDRTVSWSQPLQNLRTYSPSARLQLGLLFRGGGGISSGL